MKALPKDWQEQLAQQLPKEEIHLRIMQVTPKGQRPPYSDGSKATFLAYHDARHVMDRLDTVVGPERWRDSYNVLPGGEAVECTLALLLDGPDGPGWVSRSDVGYPNDPTKPEPEALKSAYSDALKRAGVKFGIGRYLYSLPKSGWWPIGKFGDVSAADEAKIRAIMFDGQAAPASSSPAKASSTSGQAPVNTSGQIGGEDKRIRAVYGKAKALSWPKEKVAATAERNFGTGHLSELTGEQIKKLLDYMQGLLDDAEDKAEVEDVVGDLGGEEVPF